MVNPRYAVTNSLWGCFNLSVLLQMFLGEYVHSLDEKNRISIPVKFRRELGKDLVVTRGLDACLFLYPERSWQRISLKLGSLGFGQAQMRGFSRFVFSGAVELRIDTVGRVLIPDFLLRFADLRDRVAIVGVHERVEFWSENEWNRYKARIEKQGEALAEKLGELEAF